jgi:hypothetical protein
VLQNILEFSNRLVANPHIFVGRRARDVLRGVRRGEVNPGVEQIGIEILGLLEILDGGVVVAVAEIGDALIELVASAELGATA